MKKTFMILLSLLLTASLMSAAGCRSRLKEGIERDRKRYIVNEFSLEDAYSEEEGFHYPGVPWGTGIASLQELLGVTISDVAGYGENGVLFYNADQLRTKVLARGLSRVEAGNPGFPRLVQVTSGGFSWWL